MVSGTGSDTFYLKFWVKLAALE